MENPGDKPKIKIEQISHEIKQKIISAETWLRGVLNRKKTNATSRNQLQQISEDNLTKDTADVINEEKEEEQVEKKIKKVSFGYKQSVIRLPEDQIDSDVNFPAAKTQIESTSFKNFAIQVADSSTQDDTDNYMIVTERSGRQAFSESTYDIDYEERNLTTVLVKSTGMPEVVREKWEEYQKVEEPFFYATKITGGDVSTGLLGKNEFMGLALKEDQRLDAENSLRLHKAGVKVRIPFAGWEVKELRVAGQWQNIEWFKSQGYEGDELFQSAWGMTCPLRLDDVNDMLTQAVAFDRDPSKLDPLLHDLFQLAKKDKSQPYQEMIAKWGGVDVGDILTNEQRVALWTDFGIALSKTMGQNFEALQKANLSHGNIHDQNITFFGEICDSSTAKEGLLQSAGAQKIGDDVDSFADGMRTFADRILRMQGVDTWKESQKVGEMLETVFYPQVKEGWKSYEDWVQINTQQLINDQGRRDEIRRIFVESYDPSEITENMITDEVIRKTGGENRFRAYG